MLQPGQTIAGFRILTPLARGGSGEVYAVEHLKTGYKRALKVMPADLTKLDERTRRRFEREVKAAANVQSDHFVEVIDAGHDQEARMLWIAMELLEGTTLDGLIFESGRLDREQAAEVFAQLQHGLERAHALGLVHRDLKPENIFLQVSRHARMPFTVKILDFGLFIAMQTTQAHITSHVGTPLWMAPEQITGGRVTPACDVFSLGLLAFYALSGDYYWRAAHNPESQLTAMFYEILHAEREAASVRLRALQSDVQLPRGFDEWFARCLQRDPEARYPDAKQALDALTQLLSTGDEVSAPVSLSRCGSTLKAAAKSHWLAPRILDNQTPPNPLVLELSGRPMHDEEHEAAPVLTVRSPKPLAFPETSAETRGVPPVVIDAEPACTAVSEAQPKAPESGKFDSVPPPSGSLDDLALPAAWLVPEASHVNALLASSIPSALAAAETKICFTPSREVAFGEVPQVTEEPPHHGVRRPRQAAAPVTLAEPGASVAHFTTQPPRRPTSLVRDGAPSRKSSPAPPTYFNGDSTEAVVRDERTRVPVQPMAGPWLWTAAGAVSVAATVLFLMNRQQGPVQAEEERATRQAASLQEPPTVEGLDLYLDGALVGRLPRDLSGLAAGGHRLTVKRVSESEPSHAVAVVVDPGIASAATTIPVVAEPPAVPVVPSPPAVYATPAAPSTSVAPAILAAPTAAQAPARVVSPEPARVVPPSRAAQIVSSSEKPAPVSLDAQLSFNAIPACTVVLDGKPLGRTPQRAVRVSPGSHHVVFLKDGERKVQDVTVQPGQARVISVRW